MLALQHVILTSVGWIFVVVVISSIGGTPQQSEEVIRSAMIASGIATILQAMSKGPVGSGYLCPFSSGSAYIPAAIMAGRMGGLPLLFGMTCVSGIAELGLARMIKRLRVLFPPEVTGLVVAMVGIALIRLACVGFFGFANGVVNSNSTTVALITLAMMVVPTVWSKSRLRLFPILLGLVGGYSAALTLGVVNSAQFAPVREASFFGLPHLARGIGWSFRVGMLAPFLIASLTSVLKTVGDLTLCQKINDAGWKRTDMNSVAGGLLSGAIGTVLAGLIGSMGQSARSSNVGLSIATGATSRSIALPIGSILVALAFFPKLAAVFSAVPAPVVGAVLVYVACFMILGGLQVMTSRMLDIRRTFAVGIAMIFGLSVDMTPGLYSHVPTWLQPLFSTEVSLATVLVVLLNMLFRIGVAKHRTFVLAPEDDTFEVISRFMEEQGGLWGMRKEVGMRAKEAIYETAVSVRAVDPNGPVTIAVRFDEFKVNAEVSYAGKAIDLAGAPPALERLQNDHNAVTMLSGFLVRHYADAVKVVSTNGQSKVLLSFEH